MTITDEHVRWLLAQQPQFHRSRTGQRHSWQLEDAVLDFIAGRLNPGDRTLETGSGLSTVAFALKRTEHTCVSPAPEEHGLIRAFCAEQGIALDRVAFVNATSQEALPSLPQHPLDLVLIDGAHAFPAPFIDFHYTAGRLRVGGVMVVDDTQLWTGAVLKRFLEAEPEWEHVAIFGGFCAAFAKRSAPAQPKDWMEQPFVVRHSRGTRYAAMARKAATLARSRNVGLLAAKTAEKLGGRVTVAGSRGR